MGEPHLLLNDASPAEARDALTRCCGSSAWVAGMLGRRPFASSAALYADAEAVWAGLGRMDVLEAFAHHPQIGATGAAAPAASGAAAAWSRQEQARVQDAADETRDALAARNADYLQRFGYIFIVCATGKSAAEMLALLEARIGNEPERELAIAAGEQARITRLRLEKLGA